MHSVLTAPLAILVKLKTVGVVLLVLLGRVVAALALGAGEQDIDAHGITPGFQSQRRNQRCGRPRG